MLEEFNGAMPLENMAQGLIPLQHIQVKAPDKQNVPCRVDVQRIWANCSSQRIRNTFFSQVVYKRVTEHAYKPPEHLPLY